MDQPSNSSDPRSQASSYPRSPATPARPRTSQPGPDYAGGWTRSDSPTAETPGYREDHPYRGSSSAGPAQGQPYAVGQPDARYPGYDYAGLGQPSRAGNEQSGAPTASMFAAPPAARRTRRGGSLVGAVVLAALVGAGAGVGSYALVDHGGSAGGGATSPVSVSSAAAPQNQVLNGTISAAVARIQPSVVTITVRSGQSGDIGSGVVLDHDGHVLTNYHVVSAARSGGSMTVTLANGTTTKATLVGSSSSNDLAVLKVASTGNLTPATFAKSSSLIDGQSVVAAGAPLGLSETYTSGIVSNTARPVRSGTDNDAVYLAVQTDAAINPGNSGGPLVNLNGDVVGINSSIASTGSSGDSQSGNIGIGFAIPSDVASRVASDLISKGQSPIAAMGVTVSGAGADQAADTTSTGVSLETVKSGGPAADAGLRAGDVVTKVNGFETTSSDGLIAATRFYAPGTVVTVTYVRNGGTPQTVQVTLGTL